MTREEVFNFSAGPAVLPARALERAAAEISNYDGSGMSVMEMSHRSSQFIDIFDSTKSKLRQALNVPDSHEILFLQGGASMQFSMVPINFMGENGCADYAVTGSFSDAATKEAGKYGRVNIAASTEASGHTRIPAKSELALNPKASYFYYCANNTIYGTEWKYVPETGTVPLACDMSSNILSCPVDISKYGLIFAGAQKNMAPAGVTVVIINKALAGNELKSTPLMLSYKRMIESDSMFNTPPCWSIYMLGLVLDWVNEQGGIGGMQELRELRSGILYDFLDSSRLFKGCAEKEARSGMNITFRTNSPEMDDIFIREAEAAGFLNLKGHRVAGGMRASCYNAMPVEGVSRLVEFMKEFEVNRNA